GSIVVTVVTLAWILPTLGLTLETLSAPPKIQVQPPVNPRASQKTRDVLKLLYDLPNRPDHKVISGQVIRPLDMDPSPGQGIYWVHPNVYDRIQMIHDKCGTWVGIAGAEYTDWSKAWATQNQRILSAELNPSLIAHSKRGGIVELHFHPL